MAKDIVDKAREFAAKAHKGQKRKYGNRIPYITHPEKVAMIAEELGLGKKYITAAWLHDVVEDCSVSLKDIKREFGKEITDYVRILTKEDTEDKEKYVKRFIDCKKEVAIIKLADVYHNSLDLNCYGKEKAERNRYLIKKYYLPRAKKICPALYDLIILNLENSPPQ